MGQIVSTSRITPLAGYFIVPLKFFRRSENTAAPAENQDFGI